MRCRTLRDGCTAGRLSPADPRVAGHAEGCPACRAYLARLAIARETLATPLSTSLPDAGFAARVAARLPQPVELLGWAAVRLLPAALALLVALAAYGQGHAPSAGDLWLLEPTSGELLTWAALAGTEGAP